MRAKAAILMAVLAAPASAVPAQFGSKASEILTRSVPGAGPGISAVVSEDGRIVWSGAAGRADIAVGSPLTPTSLFRYASITKQFTAALVLKLVDEKVLSLDDSLGELLPAETPVAWHKVTVRQLLNHTSGIPSYTDKLGFMAEPNTAKAMTSQQLIDLTRDDPMTFAPGTGFRYNNTGYVLLSAIVEKRTGRPWYVALREKITGPLGLKSIRCGCEPGPAVVSGYTGGNAPSQKIDMTVPSGAGALVGDVQDLARWAAALHGGKVLKAESYKAMITPIDLPGAEERYAFGLSMGEVRGFPTIEHNGGIFGFTTESIYVPSRRLFVATLSNNDAGAPNPSLAARRLLAEAAGNPFPVLVPQQVDAASLAPWFGIYGTGTGERRFFSRDGKLFTRRTGGSDMEVFGAGNNRFFYGPNSLSYFDLSTGSDGKRVMTFHANGADAGVATILSGPIPAEAAAVTLAPEQMARVSGSYATGPAVMTIARGGAGLTGQLTGQPPVPLEALGPLEFRTIGIDARLTFEEKDGKIVRVVLSQAGRTIPFERQ